MSFILDALKKSENDRQRQSGPALFEVRVAPPRSHFPMWAIAVAALLLINMSVIGWLVLRKPAAAASPARPDAEAPAHAPTVAQGYGASAGQGQAQTMAQGPGQGAASNPAFGQSQAPVSGPGANGNAGFTAPSMAAVSPQPGAGTFPQIQQPPTGSPRAEAAPPLSGTGGAQPAVPPPAEDPASNSEGNPDDYAPATQPNSSTGVFGGHVTRGTESGLPTYEEAAGKSSIPPLRLDLHVYAPDPRKRFVLVNMKRLYEGDTLPEGVKVDSITTEGAILSYRGEKFVLQRQ